jgi:hypothetical protein
MQLTPEQLKGRIKNTAKANHADPRMLMRIYMIERHTGCLSLLREDRRLFQRT